MYRRVGWGRGNCLYTTVLSYDLKVVDRYNVCCSIHGVVNISLPSKRIGLSGIKPLIIFAGPRHPYSESPVPRSLDSGCPNREIPVKVSSRVLTLSTPTTVTAGINCFQPGGSASGRLLLRQL